MIRSTIRKQGDDFIIMMPEDEARRYSLREGDEIAFYPVKQEARTKLPLELQKAVDESWERNEAGYRYLADR